MLIAQSQHGGEGSDAWLCNGRGDPHAVPERVGPFEQNVAVSVQKNVIEKLWLGVMF
jgi:hypothetical protein